MSWDPFELLLPQSGPIGGQPPPQRRALPAPPPQRQAVSQALVLSRKRKRSGQLVRARKKRKISTVAIPETQVLEPHDWDKLVEILLIIGFNNTESTHINVSPEKIVLDMKSLLLIQPLALNAFPYLKPGRQSRVNLRDFDADQTTLIAQAKSYRKKQLNIAIPGQDMSTELLERYLRVIIALNPHLVLYQRQGLSSKNRSILRDVFVTLVNPLRYAVNAMDIIKGKVCTKQGLSVFLRRTQEILYGLIDICKVEGYSEGPQAPALLAYTLSVRYAMEFVRLLSSVAQRGDCIRISQDTIPYKTIFSIFMAWWCFKYPYGMPRHASHLLYEDNLLTALERAILPTATKSTWDRPLDALLKFILVPLKVSIDVQVQVFKYLMELYATMTRRFGITTWEKEEEIPAFLNKLNETNNHIILKIVDEQGGINRELQHRPMMDWVTLTGPKYVLYTPPILTTNIPINQRIRCTYSNIGGAVDIVIELGVLFVFSWVHPRVLELLYDHYEDTELKSWIANLGFQVPRLNSQYSINELANGFRRKGLYELTDEIIKDKVRVLFTYKILILSPNINDPVYEDNREEFQVALKEFIHSTEPIKPLGADPQSPCLKQYPLLIYKDDKVDNPTQITIDYFPAKRVLFVEFHIYEPRCVSHGGKDVHIDSNQIDNVNLMLRPSEMMSIRWKPPSTKKRPFANTFRDSSILLAHSYVNVRPTFRHLYWKGYADMNPGLFSEGPYHLFMHRLPRPTSHLSVMIKDVTFLDKVTIQKKDFIHPDQLPFGKGVANISVGRVNYQGAAQTVFERTVVLDNVPREFVLSGPTMPSQRTMTLRQGSRSVHVAQTRQIPVGGPGQGAVGYPYPTGGPPPPSILHTRRGGPLQIMPGPGQVGPPGPWAFGRPGQYRGSRRGRGRGGGPGRYGNFPRGRGQILAPSQIIPRPPVPGYGYGQPPTRFGGQHFPGYGYGQPQPRRITERGERMDIDQEANPGHVLLYPRWKGREDDLQEHGVRVTEELIEKAEEMPTGHRKLAVTPRGEPILMTHAAWENAKWMIKQKNQS